MLLSIVMMVKNEEKFLYETLEALKPLMDKIDSELVILDTGSTDNTVEIAKQFTEKVYFKEWNKDFADMRNVSISYATGEWLLIIDADETLTNFDNLVEFFGSDLHKNFNSATITMKNYSDWLLKSYSEFSTIRFFKNTNEFRYEGTIHEQPIYLGPVYKNIAEFDHFGYIFEDEEFRINKLQRNEEILLEELHKNPNNPYMNYQLAKNFSGLNKIEEALKYMEISKQLYDKENRFATYVSSHLMRLYTKKGESKKCEKLCMEHIRKESNNIDVYFYLGQSQIRLGKDKKAIKTLENYLYLVENYEITAQANIISADDETKILRDDVIVTLCKLNYKLENYEEILRYFENLEKEDIKRKMYYILFMSIKKLDKLELIVEYYQKLSDSDNERSSYYYALEIFIKTLLDEEKDEIYTILSKIKDNYGTLNKIRINNYRGLNIYKKILTEEKDTIYGAIINYAVRDNTDLIELLGDMDSVWIEKYISYAIGYDRKFTIDLYKYVMKLPISLKLEDLRIYNILFKTVVFSNSLEPKKYKELFRIYNMYAYKYLITLYTNFDDYKIIKYLNSDTDRFTVEFRRLIQFENKKSVEYIRELKRVLNEYPFYKKILDMLIEDAEKNIKEIDEFSILKNQLISNVESMVSNGDLENAKNTIDEYCKSFDIDKRILNIKGVIAIMEGKLEDANLYLTKGLSLDIYNEDIIYNIEYLNQL